MVSLISVAKAYGEPHEVMEFTVNVEGAPVDIRRVFDAGFKIRDRFYGEPPYPRTTKNGPKSTTYRANLVDFVESFYPTYSPNELADFIAKNAEDSPKAEGLVLKIRERSTKDIKILEIRDTSLSYYFWLRGYNIPNDQIVDYFRGDFRKLIPTGKFETFRRERNWHIDDKPKKEDKKQLKYFQIRVRKGIRRQSSPFLVPHIKKLLSSSKIPFAVIIDGRKYLPRSLHPIHIIETYQLPVDNLEVVRR